MSTETYSFVGIKRPSISKDPGAGLDYIFNWDDWLRDGENIATKEVTVSGATLDDSPLAGALVTAWVSGGTAGQVAVIACKVTTDSTPPRTDTRRIYLNIEER